eukprot:5022010-Prymnesium_polylepis.1
MPSQKLDLLSHARETEGAFYRSVPRANEELLVEDTLPEHLHNYYQQHVWPSRTDVINPVNSVYDFFAAARGAKNNGKPGH